MTERQTLGADLSVRFRRRRSAARFRRSVSFGNLLCAQTVPLLPKTPACPDGVNRWRNRFLLSDIRLVPSG